MQVLFPPSYACYLPSRCCGGASYVVDNCIVLGGWQLHCARWLAMYCAGWLASVWPGGSVSVFPPCLCGQGRSLLWKVNTANPDTFVATFSIDLQHFPYFCNIFHIFETFSILLQRILAKFWEFWWKLAHSIFFGKKYIQICFHYDYLSRAVSPLKVILHRYNTLLSS